MTPVSRVHREPVSMLREGFGLIQNQRPENMTGFITAEEDLFAVWHLGIPDVPLDEWTLHLTGMVERPLMVTLQDLKSMPQTEIMSVHECAGSPLRPSIAQRRVGNVRWGGVRLSDLLELAGPLPDANYVISAGCDRGVYDSSFHDHYEKDLPLDKATDGTVLLALTLNGGPLPVGRGGPARLVVPGYYGTNSTKWLTTLTVSDARSPGAFTTRYYMDPPPDGTGEATPVWDLAPNSCIVGPVDGDVHPGQGTEVWGWAWAGSEPVSTVEVSTDGGLSWDQAQVRGRQGNEWQHFSYLWDPPSVGEYILASRCSTPSGATQPLTPRRNQIHRRLIFVTQENP